MPYIPGSPITARCQTCKADTEHVVIEAAGIQIRVVRCKKCSEEGPFHAPVVKPKVVAKEKKTRKKATRTRRTNSLEASYSKLLEGRDLSEVQSYNFRMQLAEGDLIRHPNFGLGVVTELAGSTKAKVLFQTGERTMICNRE